jgi:hypothetical protein
MNTVGEAIAIGTLLRYFLRMPSRVGIAMPTSSEASSAAQYLVGRAQKTGACAICPQDVRTHWPKSQ